MNHPKQHVTKHSLMHISIEIFFAILPLIVLGAFWPNIEDSHPTTFFNSPEWSMTSCILYGLSFARFQLGLSCGGPSSAAISILPLLGVIISIILISKTSHNIENDLLIYFQYVNFLASIIVFIILGGYGVSRSK